MRLYPNVVVKGQSFEGVKVVTLPMQSMTLQEVIRRFTRKESLPIEKVGVYEDRFGDLEKRSKMDIHDQMELAAGIKESIRKSKKTENEKIAREKADAEKAAAKTAESVSSGQQGNLGSGAAGNAGS